MCPDLTDPTDQFFHAFIAALARDLRAPLPGPRAQFSMAPRPQAGALPGDQPGPDARRSGVLLLFYPHAGEIYFPLILRPTYDGVHSGQVGLPGGGQEAQDADLIHTALREAHEEIGVAPEIVRILGALSPLYIQRSNRLVLPVVGWTPTRPLFRPDPHEVALLIEARLAEFLDPATRREEMWQLADRRAAVPIFGVQNQTIWGATAMILGELLALPTLSRLATVPRVPG